MSTRLSRRGLLALAGGAVGGVAAGGVLALDASTEPAATVPFEGEHQAGIVTAQQAHLRMAAYDLSAGRSQFAELLRTWSRAARILTAGRELGATHGSWTPPVDTGEAAGLPPARLTLTIGFGPSLFSRLGLEHRRPAPLIDLPAFPGDALDPQRTGGDLCVQACADDPQVAFHALRNMTRLGMGTVGLRWTQAGFLSRPGNGTPRNLMGFKDGTANLDSADAGLMAANVWADRADGTDWMHGGSYLVSRRVRIRVEAWDRTPIGEQESFVGRRRTSGAPFGGQAEHDPVDPSAIPKGAHIRAANPRTGAVSQRERILRRGYNFDDGIAPGLTQSDAGLMFLAYQRDPRRQFVTIQTRLASHDQLREYLEHTGSGIWAVPPGARAGGHVGETLL